MRAETQYTLVLLVVIIGALSVDGICPDEVAASINAILANCSICERAHVGIRVDQLETNNTWTTIYSKNSQLYLLPASNNKLLTTVSAFYEFGLNYTISTPVYVSLDGDICVAGRGDPSIAYHNLLQLAAALNGAGIKQVRNVYVDETYYDGPFLPQSWEWSDITQTYGAVPSPLVLDENSITFNLYPGQVGEKVTVNFTYAADTSIFDVIMLATTSDANVTANIQIDIQPNRPYTITISGTLPYGSGANIQSLPAIDADSRFAFLFASALASNQVKITGDVQVSECGDEGEGWKQVGSLTSPPLSDMMNYTLQVSDNLYAETFLMHLGKSVPRNSTFTTRQLGIQKAHRILTENFALADGSFVQFDGSGVSRHNMVSPDSLVSLVESIYFEKGGDIYLTFLPTAGRSGTLSDRFINTTAQGILHAKTGTLEGVNCLTGFIDHQDSEHPVIIFSILMNMGTSPFLSVVDEIGVLLSTISVKSC